VILANLDDDLNIANVDEDVILFKLDKDVIVDANRRGCDSMRN
jgi:hypothetical protein